MISIEVLANYIPGRKGIHCDSLHGIQLGDQRRQLATSTKIHWFRDSASIDRGDMSYSSRPITKLKRASYFSYVEIDVAMVLLRCFPSIS